MAKVAARPDRIDGLTVEGLAIVSADGMIADHAGVQPDSLKPEADQRFFHDTLQRADALVHGRHSGEGGPHAARRRRIVLTRTIAGVARDPHNDNTVLWNPQGAPFVEAWAMLGAGGSRLAVIGGTEVFGLFLELGYDAFHLTRVADVQLPGGRPVFPGVPDRRPEELLASHGLTPEVTRVLDASAGLTLTTWRL
jgi:dihydrofolate reductase